MQQLPDLPRPMKIPKDLLSCSRCQLTIWAREQLMPYAHHGGHPCTCSQRAIQPAHRVPASSFSIVLALFVRRLDHPTHL